MNLEFVRRVLKPNAERDRGSDLHFLTDPDSQRVYGYVEVPQRDEFTFTANPYEGKTRWYMTLESAKAYLESVVLAADIEECAALTKSVAGQAPPEPKPAHENQ
jgi:hypothetical protein